MRSLQDALYNWLTIKVVADARKEDVSAKETTQLFYEILTEEHGLSNINIKKDDTMYFVTYEIDQTVKQSRFPIELIDVMIEQMEAEPEKYVNYPEEEEGPNN
ncbi:hypothetical protein ACFSCX_03715 [Bacillus salitolerans]|uniref:Uncharacterized protein n=1 Tax=Bacillus salitolerans TaxID=1437434 RepID=A0ABW4LKJ8_9BACI